MKRDDDFFLSLLVVLLMIFVCLLFACAACGYRLGFSPLLGATPFFADTRVSNKLWSQHADAMIVHLDMPWTRLLVNETDPVELVHELLVPAVAQMNQLGIIDLFVTLDVTDHLDRSQESPQLLAINRSITEPSVQLAYAAFARAVVDVLNVTALGLAAETNFIRLAADPKVFRAVVKMARLAKNVIPRTQSTYISVQVEVAWGLLHGNGTFLGIEDDLRDFEFTDFLGFSVYPYFVFDSPSQIPRNYLTRLSSSKQLIISEMGWSSFNNSANKQAEFISLLGTLVQPFESQFVAILQPQFPDLNLTAFFPSGNVPPGLDDFSMVGLVNDDLTPKPALEMWDKLMGE